MDDPAITSKPIKTLEELESWNDDKCCSTEKSVEAQYTVATVDRAKRSYQACDVPRTLVCHDMCGGYLEDRFVHGTRASDCYRFYNWQHIDTFVYFSHHLVTSPPTGWINAAHRHGVTVLGTFITEWSDGAAVCSKIFETKDKAHFVADTLIRIAAYLKFDGWLINIENEIEKDKVPNMCDFVLYLTQGLHAQIPGSKVIWYDSVIATGELVWQDELNDKNIMFFEACDGIFLNYCWKEEHLKQSVETAKKAAQDRTCDVYVGVDIFGRNCNVGGGYHTNEALNLICKHNLSTAIFAPGWVYEVASKDKRNFVQNDYRFWNLLLQYLPSHALLHLPLVTSFCQGCGNKYYLDGEVVCEEPWYNLSIQELQPLLVASPDNGKDDGDQQNVLYTMDDAFRGGGCLKIESQLHQNRPVSFKLFNLDIKVTEKLYVGYTFKVLNSKADAYLLIKTRKETGEEITLVFGRKDLFQEQTGEFVYVDCLKGLSFPAKVIGSVKDNMWTTRYFSWPLNTVPCHLCSVYVGLVSTEDVHSTEDVNKRAAILLGQIQIFQEQDNKMDAPDIQNIRIVMDDTSEPQTEKRRLSECLSSTHIDIEWNSTDTKIIRYYNILCASSKKWILIGQSLDPVFRIMSDSIPDECKAVKLSSDEQAQPTLPLVEESDTEPLVESKMEVIVQPVLHVGTAEPFIYCAKLLLPRFHIIG